MVEKIIPLKGNAAVEKGDYVNKGDVLISGTYSYQSTNYQRGDDIYNMYSHAEGPGNGKGAEKTHILSGKKQKKRRGHRPRHMGPFH